MQYPQYKSAGTKKRKSFRFGIWRRAESLDRFQPFITLNRFMLKIYTRIIIKISHLLIDIYDIKLTDGTVQDMGHIQDMRLGESLDRFHSFL